MQLLTVIYIDSHSNHYVLNTIILLTTYFFTHDICTYIIYSDYSLYIIIYSDSLYIALLYMYSIGHVCIVLLYIVLVVDNPLDYN